MSAQLQTQAKVSLIPKPSMASMQTQILQRKCACGGTPGVDGECEECRAKRLSLQRATASPSPTTSVPPIVHDVLNSPGQPLDARTRATMEPRFGHNFSNVRVHTDAKAAESAHVVNALAYTVGRDVVFGTGQYAPETSAGMKLMAHELTHVIQQKGIENNSRIQYRLTISDPGSAGEQEAEQVSAQVISGAKGLARDPSYSLGSHTFQDWKLVLSVDREQKGLGRLISGNVGHTWVKLIDFAGLKYSYGFWPQEYFKSYAPFLSVDGCVHHPDTEHEPPDATEYSEIEYKLTEEGFWRGLNYAQRVCKTAPSYNLLSYNCTTFAINVAKEAGASPPSSTTLAIHNPNALFEGVEEEQAKRKKRVAPEGQEVQP